MPLFKGKSEAAFKHNVRTEMHEGKPKSQSLAIAYSMKRKKKASGGTVDSGDKEMNYAHGGKVFDKPHVDNMQGGTSLGPLSGKAQQKVVGDIKKEDHLAMGGDVNPMQEVTCPHCSTPFPYASPQESLTESGYQDSKYEMDMIGRAMEKRKMAKGGYAEPTPPIMGGSKYSKGGEVANSLGEGVAADELPNEFDDLALRADDMEFSETGANSGDEIGDSKEDERRNDVVMKAMLKRKAKKRD